MEKPACTWEEDIDNNWSTGCDHVFGFVDGSPEDNEFKFCPYCGGELTAQPYDDEDIEEEDEGVEEEQIEEDEE
jgi:hypothetical protein